MTNRPFWVVKSCVSLMEAVPQLPRVILLVATKLVEVEVYGFLRKRWYHHIPYMAQIAFLSANVIAMGQSVWRAAKPSNLDVIV